VNGRSDLDDDRPAELGLGGRGLGRGADQPGAGGRDAVSGENFSRCLGVGPPAAWLAGQHSVDHCPPAARIDARRSHDVARWPATPFRPPSDMPERGGGLLRTGEDGDARLGQACWRGPGRHEDRDDRLAGQADRGGSDSPGVVLGERSTERDENGDDRVDLLGLAEQAHRPPVLLGAGPGDDVHRVPDGRLGRQAAAQRGLGVAGQFRYQQPGCLAGIGDQDAGPSDVGEHRHPASRGRRLR